MQIRHLTHPRWFLLYLGALFLPFHAWSQAISPQSRITKSVDEAALATLKGNTHPLAQPQSDRGAAPPNLPMERMLLVLKRSPAQESALQKLLDDQQDKASPNYHKWLSPDEFGQQFGPNDQDIQTVTSWLGSHGFQIARVARGRTVIEFSGTAAQVQQAFHTEIHKYAVNGEDHWANSSDPQIPEALTDVVAGVDSLHNFPKQPTYHSDGVFSRSQATGEVRSLASDFTYPFSTGCHINGNCYGVGPYDFATIYNVLPLWNSLPAIDGTGQSIAIIGESNINLQDVRDFRNMFGLPPNDPAVIVDGPDPGIVTGLESEADLDVEWSGAVAPAARIKYVPSASTSSTAGIDLSALYIIENNLAPIVSESFGECELFLGTAGNAFESSIREQSAAQGITFINSSGDEGSARCDGNQGTTPQPATHGLAVSGLASTPFEVAVGGTDFLNFGPNFSVGIPSPYWAANNDVHHSSALGYIPESAWNSSCTNNVFVILGYGATPEASCNNSQARNWVETIAGGGGKSGCTVSDGADVPTCSGGYAKPSWQSAPGVPNDGARDIPDVSLFASPGFNDSFYVVCESDRITSGGSCTLNSPYTNFLGFGGTSASAPAFAGIMALVNQYAESAGQGNANYVLYKLAALPSQQGLNCNASASAVSGCIFNDVTSGTIAVPCSRNSPNCNFTNGSDAYGVLSGYSAGTGYDLATGLGSLNVYNLVHDWSLAKFTPAATSLTLNGGNSVNIAHGQSVPVSITVTSGSGTPTGDVSLLAIFANESSAPIDRFHLTNGSASGNTNLLPGGSYTVKAHYAGDATFGASDSSTIDVSVAAENSEAQFGFVTFGPNGNVTATNATTVTYGSPYVLRVGVTNAAGTPCQPDPLGESACPTGSVTLTDNNKSLDAGTYNLNSLGFFEDRTIQLVGGVHSLQASYAGDNSFKPSITSSSVTVTPAATNTGLSSGGQTTVGNSILITATVSSKSNGAAPTGMVTFMNGSAPLGNPISVSGITSSPGSAQATAALTTQLPVGLNTITAHYSGDANYAASPSGSIVVDVQIPTTITISSSNSTVAQGTSVSFTAIVTPSQSGGPAIGGQVEFTGFAPKGNVGASAPVINGQAVYTTNLQPTLLPTGVVTLTARYEGDTNYALSSSGNITETVNPQPGTDFTLSTPGPNPSSVTIPAPGGTSASVAVTVTPLNGFTGTVVFPYPQGSCTISPPGSLSTCNISIGTVPFGYVSPGQMISFSVNTTAPSSFTRIPAGRPDEFNWWTASVGTLLVLILLVALPPKRRSWSAVVGLVFFACLTVALVGCGAGGTGGGGGSGGSTQIPGTPTGVVYTATVTGSCGPLIHSTSFTFMVQ